MCKREMVRPYLSLGMWAKLMIEVVVVAMASWLMVIGMGFYYTLESLVKWVKR